MPSSVVVGAGPVGRATARLLADAGEDVRLVSRSGRGPAHSRIDLIAADATDTARLVELAGGARTLFNCAMPPYDRWPAEFPPLAAALLATAEQVGADYVMAGNTYGYGPVDGPLTEDLPMAPTTVKGRVRARIWTDALHAHEQGRVRVAEVRAGEYIGAGAVSGYTLMVVPAVLAGVEAPWPGDLDVTRSWNDVGDVGATLVAASRSEHWGRAWHVPPVADLSARALTHRLAALAGAPTPNLRAMPVEELRELGESEPIMAEVVEMYYLSDRPHVLDSTRTEHLLGVHATPVDQVLRATIGAEQAAAR